MIKEYFYSSEYNDKIVLQKGGAEVSLGLLKKYISYQIKRLKTLESKSVNISSDDNFEFIVIFLAAIFAGKEIYLSDRKTECYKPEKFDIDEEFYKFPKINTDEVFVNFFTSGSTSEPKVIKKSFTNLLNEQRDLFEKFADKFEENFRFLSTSTLTHMFCLTFNFMLPFFSGFVIDCERVLYPEELDEKENYVLVSTPSFLDRICDYKLKSFPHLIITAGAKLKDETFKAFSQNSQIIEIYGSTESGVVAYRLNPGSFNLFDNVQIRALEDGVFVRAEYFLEDEIFLSDAVEMVDERRFIIKERTDRMAKINEKRVSLNEVESIIKSHKFVKDVLCLVLAEKLCAVVVLSDEGKDFVICNSNIELIWRLKDFTAEKSGFVPKKWRFTYEIPKNICGKIDFDYVKSMFNKNLSFPIVFDRRLCGDEIFLDMIFAGNSNFFKGHFEGFAILPGVIQLYFASYFIEKLFNVRLSKNEFKKVKFSNIITPNVKITLKLTRKNDNFEYTYIGDDIVYSSGIFMR